MDPQEPKIIDNTAADETAKTAMAERVGARLESDGSLLFTGLSLAPVPDRVEPAGVVFRGAPRAQPGPGMPYTITQRELVWADNLQELIERAKRRQWNASTDIPWAAGRNVAPDVEDALAVILTWMLQQEYAAWYLPAKFVAQIHPAYTEVGLFLSTQIVDEARHIEVFLKRLYLNGVGLQEGAAGAEVGQKFVEALEARLSFPYEVPGLPPYVQEALAIVAGRGRSPVALGRGVQRVRQFIDELNANRKQRLLQSGFPEPLAEHISQLHIRSSGGLM